MDIFLKICKNAFRNRKTWVLLENDYVDVKNKKGEVLYRIKECVDDFSYSYTDNAGHRKTLKLTEKRIVTFHPKLAEKQIYEINRQVEKAKNSGRVKQKIGIWRQFQVCYLYFYRSERNKNGWKSQGRDK